jgi:quercetin dioxygenase-like cupin family protein
MSQKGVSMKDTYELIPNLYNHVKEIPANSILSQTISQDENARYILFAFAEGEELSEHTASKQAVLYFVKGEADLTLGEDKTTAEAGTWVRMPPNMPHSILAKTEVLMLLEMIE